MGNLKISEIQALKNVKFNLPLLKLCLQCMNLYSINDGEKGLETDPKKLLDFLKKILNDPKFVANLIEVQLTDDTLSIFQREIFTSPDWDASTGYKIAYFLGLFIKWSSTLYDLLKIRKEVEPYVEEVNRLSVLIDEKELLKDETYEKIQTTQDKINDVEGKIKKIQSSYEQLMIELDRCLEKKSLGNLVYENFKGVIEFWSNILSKIKEDLITLLGDVAFYSMDIVLCSPFTLDQRDRLRRSFEEKAIKLEILFSQNYLQQLLEPNTTLCWSHFIHARDEFSLSKLCTIKSNLHWSYIFNLNDEGYQILLSAEKDKKIEYIRYGSKGYLNKLENAVVGGFLTIIEDVSSYDYRLKNILTKNLITKKNDSGKVLEQWINIGENRVEYSNDFKLYLISSSSSIIKEYQSKCQLLNFQLASNMLTSIFSDTILSQKNAKEKLKLDNVVNQMIRTTKSIEDLTDELLSSLDIEKSILDVPGLGNKLMENEKEFSRLRCLYDNLEMFQRKLNNSTDDDHSLRLAKKCSIIFEVIRKLTYLDNYDITLKKFLSIIKVSLMNKEHQDRIPIPEVLNQLRSMFSDRAHYSIFVFWLYFYLNFNGSNMNVLKLIEELMNGQCSGFFDEAISIFCDFFSEEKADLILDVNKNKLFFNLLPQPWLSRLNPFQIFVLKTIGQPDRVIDLAQEFSNNFDIDSTFVDVLESDFGQFPSSMSNKAIVLSTNDEESEEEIRLINKFSGRQKINSIFISFDEGIQVISDAMIKAQKLGKWIIITDYRSDNFEDLKKLIARNNFQVHKDFKLWILNYKRQIPKEIWRECLVINQSPPDTFHQRFTSLLVNGISDEEFMTLPHSESDPESGFGKMLDIFFRLALFHSCIIERIKYGPRGGWNIPYKFNQSHFRIVTELFKTHFIRLPFEHNRDQCLRAIIIDCFYKQYLSDERDFNLLSTMFHTLMSTSQINLKKISSVSDMVEVAKSLEENQIISLLNISQSTQSFYQFKKSKDFMKTLIMYPSGGEDVLLSQEVIISKLKLIRSVLEKKEDETTCGLFECTRKEDYILDYIWTIEIQELRKCISTIKDDIEYIFWVVNRETLINTDFTALWSPLRVNKVPLSWINHINKEEHTPTFSNFSSSLSKRINYFQTGFNKNIIELNALSHARIFLNGLVLHIMKESIETDGLCGSFIDEIPSLSPGNIFYLKGVKLEGASWDPRRSALIAETARLESFSIISLRKGNLKEKEQNYSCPFYLTQSRVLNDSSSSFHFNIYIPTLMSQEKHVEMSTAVMIEDFE
ncbi:dynein axonemal heavy chain 1 [Lepeophtheirus salmonis]|uniref:dynein axonemal heavy chain 1 n=1 Tax=Lepeophtheirus salmonis TaxID=72036 RepID=UPI003AF3E6AE